MNRTGLALMAVVLAGSGVVDTCPGGAADGYAIAGL